METKYFIDMLTKDGVSIRKQNTITVDNVIYEIGEPQRTSYSNSNVDRQKIQNELQEDISSTVLNYWGDKTTVEENIEF